MILLVREFYTLYNCFALGMMFRPGCTGQPWEASFIYSGQLFAWNTMYFTLTISLRAVPFKIVGEGLDIDFQIKGGRKVKNQLWGVGSFWVFFLYSSMCETRGGKKKMTNGGEGPKKSTRGARYWTPTSRPPTILNGTAYSISLLHS